MPSQPDLSNNPTATFANLALIRDNRAEDVLENPVENPVENPAEVASAPINNSQSTEELLAQEGAPDGRATFPPAQIVQQQPNLVGRNNLKVVGLLSFGLAGLTSSLLGSNIGSIVLISVGVATILTTLAILSYTYSCAPRDRQSSRNQEAQQSESIQTAQEVDNRSNSILPLVLITGVVVPNQNEGMRVSHADQGSPSAPRLPDHFAWQDGARGGEGAGNLGVGASAPVNSSQLLVSAPTNINSGDNPSSAVRISSSASLETLTLLGASNNHQI